MTPTLQWSVNVVRVIWMVVGPIPLTCCTTVLDSLVVRIATFATDTGVVDMIPFPVLSARHTLDLVICQSWIDEEMTAA